MTRSPAITTTRTKKQREILEKLAAELDSTFFKALADPIRIELLKLLIVEGQIDVEGIAQRFPQDRSVISRHLATLRDAGILQSERDGRHMYYCAEPDFFIGKLERMLKGMRELRDACCKSD